ncbi:DUF2945 domain-containing protein [Streptomyces sp. NPDC088736]|uniref:DUF2945 domain-containing protein n=1 Tax=Streptomyces sp. NPDC088736 TaxID=3365881 RepID=UPI0037F26A40
MAGAVTVVVGEGHSAGETWKSHGNTASGTVEKKIARRMEAAGRTVDASQGEPQYELRSGKSGRPPEHNPSVLKKSE